MKKISLAFTSLLTAITLLMQPSEASAWTTRGHQVVADIAEANLTPSARQEVSRLLALEGKSHLNEVSSWADSIRGVTFPRQPSHAVRIPLDANSYSSERDCADNNCVLEAISHNIADLSNKNSDDESRLVALKYLVHFIGDLHQPLHANKDTGARKVIFNGQVRSLHEVWDQDIVSCPGLKFPEIARQLEKNEPVTSVGNDPVKWAMESHDIARDFVFPGVAGLPGDPILLPRNYCDVNWPIARSRLKLAGVRLAALLNETLGRD